MGTDTTAPAPSRCAPARPISRRTDARRAAARGALAFTALLLSAAVHPADKAREGMVQRQDLEIVDCLLPGQVRQLGNMTYLTQRRPTHTTAADCRIRGGEYVAYDRADAKSALHVWLPAAEAGDPEAATNVGEIYERGIGTEPNYEAAVIWYKKAADKGYARAQFDLGTLYEQGLGVPADRLAALNLYRQAWGLPEDNLMYASAAQHEQDELRAQLEKQVAEKDQQLGLLQKQLQQMQNELARKSATGLTGSNAEVEALKKWIAQLEAERRSSSERIAAMPKLRMPQQSVTDSAPSMPTALDARTAQGLSFGRYYALVIGNQHYEAKAVGDLDTPINDATRAAQILTQRYGFTVQILKDATDVEMLKALNDLNGVLKPDDNLLIYYAGHGERLGAGPTESGYWLPVNADPPPQDLFWLPNEQITGHLARLQARRILVVADSCYAGLLSTDPSYLFVSDKVGYTKEYLAYKLPKRARLLISSGGNEPVLDSGGSGDSIFARAFLDVLESNRDILATPELFARIRKRVEGGAAPNRTTQQPQFKSIKGAGHEVGDFFFVPKG
jgi:TPR repeat protein